MTAPDKTRELRDALRRRHAYQTNGLARAWIYAEEVRVSTGFSPLRGGSDDRAIRAGADQRIDAFALHTWPSQSYKRVAFEIKVTRSDLTRELSNPAKCAAALALSNQFYLVVPPELVERVEPAELPPTWGLMTLSPEPRIRIRIKAPWRDTPAPPYSFMLSLARNLQATAL